MSLVFESCNVEELYTSLGGSEKLLIELVDKLEEWLRLQPHLPQDASRKRLEVLIVNSKFSLEQAKKKLDTYYTIKALVPEFYCNRNPLGPSITSLHERMNFVILPKLTYEKYRTIIVRLTGPDSSGYHSWEKAKYILMAYEIMMAENQSFGEIIVSDLSMMSLGHILKLTPPLLKKGEIVITQAYAVRIKGIHFINAPPIAHRLFTLLKSVISSKLGARIHVHPNLELLYQFVPKSVLPKDYGDEQPTMNELAVELRKRVEGAQDWFLAQEKVLVDERLRPGPAFDADSLFGFSGSFRKLDVD